MFRNAQAGEKKQEHAAKKTRKTKATSDKELTPHTARAEKRKPEDITERLGGQKKNWK